MAELWPFDDEQRAAWTAWVASRPPAVRAVAERLPPNRLYRMTSSGHRVTIYSFEEHDGDKVTLKVDVTGQYNFVTMSRRVFGVDPDDLEECELPGPNEPIGDMGMDVDQTLAAMAVVNPEGYRDIMARRAANLAKRDDEAGG